jgi:hypothetical protein
VAANDTDRLSDGASREQVFDTALIERPRETRRAEGLDELATVALERRVADGEPLDQIVAHDDPKPRSGEGFGCTHDLHHDVKCNR